MSGVVPAVIFIVVMVLTWVLIGALVSLGVLLPPLRKLGQRSTMTRMAEVFIIALLSLAISFGLWTRLGAEVVYIFGTIGPAPWQEVEDPNRSAIVNELWVRRMMLPPLQRSCYSREAIVCQRADQVAGWSNSDSEVTNRGWGSYLLDIGICLVAPLTGGFRVWSFTRRQQG